MRIELVEGVAGVEREAGHDDAVAPDVVCDPAQHGWFGSRRDEDENVAGDDRGVERSGLAEGGQVQFAEVAHQPGRSGVILPRGRDEFDIDIDADDVMAAAHQVGTDPAGTAACVEDPGPRRDECVDEAGLADQVRPISGHPPKALNVGLRVAGVEVGEPPRLLRHGPHTAVARAGRVSSMDPAPSLGGRWRG